MADTAVNLHLVEISALAGTGLPILAAVFKQDRLSPRTNTIIAAVLAMVAALAATLSQHDLTATSFLTSFTATYTTAVAFYHGLWKPTGIAPTVQTRTSPKRRPATRRRPAAPVAANSTAHVERAVKDLARR